MAVQDAFVHAVRQRERFRHEGPLESVRTDLGSRRIAFIRGGKHARLWVIDPNGSGLPSLHVRVIEDYGVAWSPDGRRIAFTPPSGHGLYTANADGGDVQRLTRGSDGTPAWLP